ncbi:MAG: glycine--tRNA ligase subunit beta [Desulfosarcinaceae bacterium]|nr:glycine--tRNA ligase subunit beta [Desulfosarcinaceae bacterium]
METLLLEIGTEEIPAGYIAPALKALSTHLQQQLTHRRITFGRVATFGTPRRLAVTVREVAARQETVSELLVGPPEKVGFDDQGQPTMAARKFAEKAGVSIKKLFVEETDKGRYLAARRTQRGKSSLQILKEILPEVILATPFPKTMRWADWGISFARPIQSVMALWGAKLVSFTLNGHLKSGRTTQGHMFMHPKKLKLAHADDYADRLAEVDVVVDIDARRTAVQAEVDAAARKLGGTALADAELTDIVTNLVETPIASAGRFDEIFLELPREILITSMREHQKYFAVEDGDGRLLPAFVAVNNTRTRDPQLVANGHQRVLRARLSDARFFFQADLQVPMDAWVEKLSGVLFQAKLGSMQAKVQRVSHLATWLANQVRPELAEDAARAAKLCKADLVSQVVVEFPKLQGVMGRVYAQKAGERGDIPTAIEEHYRPIASGARLPASDLGAILAVADKIDSICGIFAIGLKPTGASDPYALRRQGIGIAQILADKNYTVSLQDLIGESVAQFADQYQSSEGAVAADVYTFLANRIARLMVEAGNDKELVAAVVSVSVDEVPAVWNRVRALTRLRQEEDFEPLAAAFKRVGNIIKKADAENLPPVDSDLLRDPAERALFDDYGRVRFQVSQQVAAGQLDAALASIASLRGAVDRFFDDVMVMVDDAKVRTNRLALLAAIAGLYSDFADFGKISA